MGRTVVRQLDPPRGRKGRDRFTALGIALVLLLALVGLVSSGLFVASKVGASSSTSKQHRQSTGNLVSVRDLQRAQAQATALIRAAEDASNSIVRSATKNAHTRAAAIVAAARRQAHRIVAAAPTPAPVLAVPTAAPPVSVGSAAGSTGVTNGSQFGSGATTVYPTPAPVTSGALGTTGTPNLAGVPATWLVVGYNATFGSGPGTAGSISVLNRGKVSFSGVAVVQYTRGGSASAPFSGLAPGQSLTLPLNGKPYAGGGYRIILEGLR